MLPLFAGGQFDRGTGRPRESAVALSGRVLSLATCLRFHLTLTGVLTFAAALAGLVAAATAEPVVPTGIGAGAKEISIDAGAVVPDPVGMEGIAVVSYITPSAAPAPRGLDNGARDGHWTLRDRAPLRMIKSDAGASEDRPNGPVYIRSHTSVAMFSWREIAFAALVVAFALGALLALTGGGDNHHTRHY